MSVDDEILKNVTKSNRFNSLIIADTLNLKKKKKATDRNLVQLPYASL